MKKIILNAFKPLELREVYNNPNKVFYIPLFPNIFLTYEGANNVFLKWETPVYRAEEIPDELISFSMQIILKEGKKNIEIQFVPENFCSSYAQILDRNYRSYLENREHFLKAKIQIEVISPEKALKKFVKVNSFIYNPHEIDLKCRSIKSLQQELANCLANEEFEKAAELRDEIKEREG